jgi:hypothetical protein
VASCDENLPWNSKNNLLLRIENIISKCWIWKKFLHILSLVVNIYMLLLFVLVFALMVFFIGYMIFNDTDASLFEVMLIPIIVFILVILLIILCFRYKKVSYVVSFITIIVFLYKWGFAFSEFDISILIILFIVVLYFTKYKKLSYIFLFIYLLFFVLGNILF